MLPAKLVFVDIETSGGSISFDRIIEIGLVRVEEGIVTKTFSSLLNPNCHIPEEITRLTEIKREDVEKAPSFYSLKDELAELMSEAIFVAHNVRFDYGFLKSEFKRVGIDFSPKQLCTVKLSRQLFPAFRHHNLDILIERLSLKCSNRHRAFDDAQVLWQFYQKVQQIFPPELLIAALERISKRPTAPIHLQPNVLEALPEGPGVYIFYGDSGAVLYVGKSVNIKDRVLSHFAADHQSAKEMNIAQQIKTIETIPTAGELGALILESQLVKKLMPLYNHQLRYAYKMLALRSVTSDHGYQTVEQTYLDDFTPNQLSQLLGVYRSKKQLTEFLRRLARDFGLCEKLLGISNQKGSCFGYQLGKCRGACVGQEEVVRYNLRFLEAFSRMRISQWPFDGGVVISDYDPLTDLTERFLVDNWCIIGKVSETGVVTAVGKEAKFDMDTYKILRRFVKERKNTAKIKVIKNSTETQPRHELW